MIQIPNIDGVVSILYYNRHNYINKILSAFVKKKMSVNLFVLLMKALPILFKCKYHFILHEQHKLNLSLKTNRKLRNTFRINY